MEEVGIQRLREEPVQVWLDILYCTGDHLVISREAYGELRVKFALVHEVSEELLDTRGLMRRVVASQHGLDVGLVILVAVLPQVSGDGESGGRIGEDFRNLDDTQELDHVVIATKAWHKPRPKRLQVEDRAFLARFIRH